MILLMGTIGHAEEIDPIATQLESELRRLKDSYDRAVAAKKKEAITKYEWQLRRAMQRGDLPAANRFQAKISSLRDEALPPAADGAATEDLTDFESNILGEWILENAHGKTMSLMEIEKSDEDVYKLTRLGGGPFAVCGEYKVENMRRLVKVRKPNDAFWDLTWHYSNGKLKLKKGQYKNWIMRRAK
jgi:hypothetical protein